jgi:hypothetical protein
MHGRFKRNVLNNLNGVFQGFQDTFSDGKRTTVKLLIAQILSDIQRFKQLMQIQRAWNKTYSFVFKSLDQHMSYDSTLRLRLASIQKYFSEPREKEEANIQAIFHLSLQSDIHIRRLCYSYLTQRLSLIDSAYKSIESFGFCRSEEEAIIVRLINAYKSNARKYLEEALDNDIVSQAFAMEKLSFCFENIAQLCVGRVSFAKKAQPPPQNANVVKYRYWEGIHVQNPRFDEQLFELDLEDARRDAGSTGDFLSYFRVTADRDGPRFEQDSTPPAVPIESLFSDFCWHLAARISNIPNVSDGISWQRLLPCERFVIDSVLGALANLGRFTSSMTAKWFRLLSDVVLRYFPRSEGAIKLAKVFILHLSGSETAHFLDEIFSIIDKWQLPTSVLVLSILNVVMMSTCVETQQKGLAYFSRILSVFLDGVDMSTILSNLEKGDQFEIEKQRSILETIAALTNGVQYLTTYALESLRSVFGFDRCCSCLTSLDMPFRLKPALIAITLNLHPHVEDHIEELVEDELKHIRYCTYLLIEWTCRT